MCAYELSLGAYGEYRCIVNFVAHPNTSYSKGHIDLAICHIRYKITNGEPSLSMWLYIPLIKIKVNRKCALQTSSLVETIYHIITNYWLVGSGEYNHNVVRYYVCNWAWQTLFLSFRGSDNNVRKSNSKRSLWWDHLYYLYLLSSITVFSEFVPVAHVRHPT